MNPAASVRGPKHVVKRGKTPVLTAQQARQLLDSIDTSTIVGLRDRPLVGVMVYSFARVGAVVGMRIEDYYQSPRRSGSAVETTIEVRLSNGRSLIVAPEFDAHGMMTTNADLINADILAFIKGAGVKAA